MKHTKLQNCWHFENWPIHGNPVEHNVAKCGGSVLKSNMYISNRKTIPKNTAHATKLCSLLNKSVHAWHFEVLSGLLSPLTLEPLKTFGKL